MSGRTRRSSPDEWHGRLKVADKFDTAANLIEEFVGEPDGTGLNNAYVTLCVHAGIAASDVICGARLGQISRGEDHKSAVTLLARVDQGLSTHLGKLLALKDRAAYQPSHVSDANARRAGRASRALLGAAREALNER